MDKSPHAKRLVTYTVLFTAHHHLARKAHEDAEAHVSERQDRAGKQGPCSDLWLSTQTKLSQDEMLVPAASP